MKYRPMCNKCLIDIILILRIKYAYKRKPSAIPDIRSERYRCLSNQGIKNRLRTFQAQKRQNAKNSQL